MNQTIKPKETLGKRVGRLRIDYLQMTLKDLSKKTGLSTFTILYIENGRTQNPYMPTIQALSKAFGVTLEFLVNGSKKDWIWSGEYDRLLPPDEVITRKQKFDV